MNAISIDKKILDVAKRRNFSTNLVKSLNIPQEEIDKRLKFYYSIPQPAQKSQAWLDQRTNFITASSFSNALSPKWSSYRNELMKNKVSKGSYNNFFGNEATRWGEKYEDVCCAIYSYRNNVEVFDFGMIPHPKYPFLGASTDGITTKLINLEIKSPYSRVIKPGVVKDIYWQQMQLQMDVLDLNLSHFLECSFHEYPSERDFWIDFDYDGLVNPEKGIVIEIVNRDIMDNSGVPKTMYIYSPIALCENANQMRVWHKQMISDIISSKDKVYIRSHYWILSVYSCVNVIRDREWFNQQIPKFIEFWNEVETYRSNGGLEKLSTDIDNNKPKSRKIKVESPSETKLNNNKISLSFDDDGIDDLPPGYIMSSSDEETEPDNIKKNQRQNNRNKSNNNRNRNRNSSNDDDLPLKAGGGCLIESSDDEAPIIPKNNKSPSPSQQPPKSDERIQLDDAIEASVKNLQLVKSKLNGEIPIEKPKPNISKLKFKRAKRQIPVDFDQEDSLNDTTSIDSIDSTKSTNSIDSSTSSVKSTKSSICATDSIKDYESDDEDDIIFRPDPYRPKINQYHTTRQSSGSSYDTSSNGSNYDEPDEDTIPCRPTIEQPKYFKRYKNKKDANKKRIETRSRSTSKSIYDR
jgi:putative phage-type endonuclease